MKTRPGIIWRCNAKAWLTKVFLFWVDKRDFCPTINKGLPLQALLMVNNVPVHPQDLQELVLSRVLPTYYNSSTQFMHQQVIPNFKKLYTRELVLKCSKIVSDTDFILKEFGRNFITSFPV